ncbi:MAG: hypothetical protein HY735_28505 [Verrucomicrobia bacterium]|nr:hypothetical protein [Verrucomicrobiota bacterium]
MNAEKSKSSTEVSSCSTPNKDAGRNADLDSVLEIVRQVENHRAFLEKQFRITAVFIGIISVTALTVAGVFYGKSIPELREQLGRQIDDKIVSLRIGENYQKELSARVDMILDRKTPDIETQLVTRAVMRWTNIIQKQIEFETARQMTNLSGQSLEQLLTRVQGKTLEDLVRRVVAIEKIFQESSELSKRKFESHLQTLGKDNFPQEIIAALPTTKDNRILDENSVRGLATRHKLLDPTVRNADLRFKDGDISYWTGQKMQAWDIEIEFLARYFVLRLADKENLSIANQGELSRLASFIKRALLTRAEQTWK